MAVFVYDRTDGLVKIVERSGKFYVYKIRTIFQRGQYRDKKTEKYKFIWEKRSFEKHNYKPYEDDDVSYDPDIFINDIKRFDQHMIRRV